MIEVQTMEKHLLSNAKKGLRGCLGYTGVLYYPLIWGFISQAMQYWISMNQPGFHGNVSKKKIDGSFKEHYFLSWRLRPNRGGNDKTTGTKFFLLKSRRFKGYTFFFQLMKLKIRKDEDIAGVHVFP